MIDYTGIPNPHCPECGAREFVTWIVLDPDDYEIGMYGTDGHCLGCKTKYTIGIPEEHPDMLDETLNPYIEEEEEDEDDDY
jgi:hypothetical protein